MNLNRLFFLSVVFIGLSATADAQYTNRSGTSSGYTTRTAPARQGYAAPARQAQGSAAAAKPAPSYVNRSQATAPASQQQQQQQARPNFRPRQPAPTNEDDLPSFDQLEGKAGAGNTGDAGTATAEGGEALPPPPPPPKGQVWVYLTNFKDEGGYIKYCSWEMVVQNRTDADLKLLLLNYKLTNVNSQFTVENVAAGASTVTESGIYSSKCAEIGRVKPSNPTVIECQLGSVSDKDCESYITIK